MPRYELWFDEANPNVRRMICVEGVGPMAGLTPKAKKWTTFDAGSLSEAIRTADRLEQDYEAQKEKNR